MNMLYPILTSSRTVMDLSGIWKFKPIDDLEPDQYVNKWNDDYDTMAVPASYNDLKENEALRDHYGFVLYQKDITIAQVLRSERIVLRFGSVTHHATVYLNGKKIAYHKGGFLPFEVEIDEFLCDGEMTLTVAVDNRIDHSTLPVGSENAAGVFGGILPPVEGVEVKKENTPKFDFFNYSGIHRPVKIYSTPKEYIQDILLNYSVDGTNANIHYQIDVYGQGETSVEILDERGKVVGTGKGVLGDIKIENVQLWEPLNAYLYTARVTFANDCYEEPFGIRTIRIEGTKFLINEKPFYFKGYGKHEDSSYKGRGMDEALNLKDISLMKWMGANSLRTSHYPYSEEMMRLCDREGIVVIDEVAAVGINLYPFGSNDHNAPDTYSVLRTKEHHHDVVRDLIDRDKNHACVCIWCIGNESDTAVSADSAYQYYKEIYDLAHERDPQNRPVTLVGVQGGKYGYEPALETMDIICLNRYYGWYIYGGDLNAAKQAAEIEIGKWGRFNKPVMITEYECRYSCRFAFSHTCYVY